MNCYRSNYFHDFPYWVEQDSTTNDTDRLWSEVYAWCREQFGAPSEEGRWLQPNASGRWHSLCIRTETDAAAFKIRWG